MNVGVAIALDDKGVIDSIKIAPGCVFATPNRVTSVEALLIGKVPNEQLLLDAGEAMVKEMIERTGIRPSTEYKKSALEALTREVLGKALRRCNGKNKIINEG